jgi:hypothetical protein
MFVWIHADDLAGGVVQYACEHYIPRSGRPRWASHGSPPLRKIIKLVDVDVHTPAATG